MQSIENIVCNFSCPLWGSGSVVVDLLLNVLPIVCGSSVFVFVSLCITLCPFFFDHLEEEEKTGCFAIIVLHNIVTINVLWLFLTVQWVGLLCVIIVFSDHTHSLFHGRSVLITLNIGLDKHI